MGVIVFSSQPKLHIKFNQYTKNDDFARKIQSIRRLGEYCALSGWTHLTPRKYAGCNCCLQCCWIRARFYSRSIACNIARNNSEVDTRCNWHVARNIAHNVASSVRTLRVLYDKHRMKHFSMHCSWIVLRVVSVLAHWRERITKILHDQSQLPTCYRLPQGDLSSADCTRQTGVSTVCWCRRREKDNSWRFER